MDDLPYSQACENNKAYILEHLRGAFADCRDVLEIASGTAQHACHFAQHMPWLQWQPTELAQNLPYLTPRCNNYVGENLLPPIPLDVCDRPWPAQIKDAVFSANSLHIMPYYAVEKFFQALGEFSQENTALAIYGPFNYAGRYSSESNARFDQWLLQQHPESAIRDFEAVDALAKDAGFSLQDDHAMPANNQLLIWQRKSL